MTWKIVVTRSAKKMGRKGRYPVDRVMRQTLESGLTFAEAKQRRAKLAAELGNRLRAQPDLVLVAERGGAR